ncbi:phosphatidylserine decarboxylase [Aeromonas sobria]|uniref:Phosphatidylserine decarboxylase proenzyme n=1 Tax=Aeromonas sobria TaxID=646 RepID=A0A2N3J5L6_AERSO|nr:archaetidylserine decarboxylase [Aeromonas sobria]PKQ81538.1 phosphatidylserine decarboxylase [Aeromonas sobria]
MSITDNLKIAGQYCLPKHALSRLVGKFAAAQAGNLTTRVIETFIKQYQVDMSEALHESPAHYKSFNEFFTRELKPGIRPIVEDAMTLALPVDGTVSQLGPIQQGRIIQAKGHDYSARELLGGCQDLVAPFQGGDFATIYLAPKDYHRIHMPLDGVLESMVFVPGDLFSVNPLTAENVPNLFARNERVVATFRTTHGPMALVLVGATIVASIETIWAGNIAPAKQKGVCGQKEVVRWDYSGDEAITLQKGAEMGLFKLGSTVVCLFGPGMLAGFESHLTNGVTTRMGQPFAKLTEQA